MRIDVHHHYEYDRDLHRKVDRLTALLETASKKESSAMTTAQETLDLVTANSSRIDSLITLFNKKQDELNAALATVAIPPDVQEKIDAIFATNTADAAKVDKALNANVPPPPPAG